VRLNYSRRSMTNGHGGARPGAGRPRGRKSTSTLKRAAALRRAAAKNVGPVEFLLREMRDPKLPRQERWLLARWVAPYVSPRLSSVEVVKSVKAMSIEELQWAISDAERATAPVVPGWKPQLVSGGRR
jgi:hypothetical protein